MHRSARARGCSTSPGVTGPRPGPRHLRARVVRCSRPSSSPGPSSAAVTAQAAEETGLLRGHAGRRRRRRHPVGPARHRGDRPRTVHDPRRQLLAAHDAARQGPRRSRGSPAHLVPRHAGPLDDGRDRLLLRHRHALVPRRLLRARAGTGCSAKASTSTRIMEDKACRLCRRARNGVIGLFSNVMQASRWVHTTPGLHRL